MATGEPKTLLSRPAIDTKDPLAWLWLVSNNVDYRLSLSTLLSFIDKTTVGLDKVNNTSDVDKPVSNAVAIALNGKADKSEIVTRAEYDALIEQLALLDNGEAVALLNTQVTQLQQGLAQRLTAAEAGQMISDGLSDISSTLDQAVLRLQLIESGQHENLVNPTTLATELLAVNNRITQAIEELLETHIEQLAASFSLHLQQYGAFSADMEERVSALETTSADVTVGPNEW